MKNSQYFLFWKNKWKSNNNRKRTKEIKIFDLIYYIFIKKRKEMRVMSRRKANPKGKRKSGCVNIYIVEAGYHGKVTI